MKSFPRLGLKAFAIGAGDEEVFASSLKMIHQSVIVWSGNLLAFVAQD